MIPVPKLAGPKPPCASSSHSDGAVAWPDLCQRPVRQLMGMGRRKNRTIGGDVWVSHRRCVMGAVSRNEVANKASASFVGCLVVSGSQVYTALVLPAAVHRRRTHIKSSLRCSAPSPPPAPPLCLSSARTHASCPSPGRRCAARTSQCQLNSTEPILESSAPAGGLTRGSAVNIPRSLPPHPWFCFPSFITSLNCPSPVASVKLLRHLRCPDLPWHL